MPSASKHESKAKSNRRVLEKLDIETAADWAVVVAFYTAVHLIEHLRALDGQHSISHLDRNEYVKGNHREIHADFHTLYSLSLVARYSANVDFYKAIESDVVKEKVLGKSLSTIDQYVSAFISNRN